MSVVVETCHLTHADRCDRCSARAYVLVVLEWAPGIGDGELLFCGHHYEQHEKALEQRAEIIHDERAQLREHVRDDHHV